MLHLAATRDDAEAELILRHLIAAGADLEATDSSGANVLHVTSVDPQSGRLDKFMEIFNQVQALRRPELITTLLAAKDNNGRSAFVRLANNALSNTGRIMGQWLTVAGAGRTLANIPDADGVTPFIAAVLSENLALVGAFRRLEIYPSSVDGQPTVQEIARSREAWNILALLPDDRPLPDGLRPGLQASVKRELQQRLKDWGYYTGTVDGAFGPGSRAAMTRFLKDRREELIAMSGHNPRILLRRPTPSGDSNTTLSLKGPRGSDCEWRVVEWQTRPNSNESRQFIGCVEGGDMWNANGFAYVEYSNGSSDIFLFGPQGWDNARQLR